MLKLFFSLFFVLSFSKAAVARPEYAVRHGVVSCQACHYSPSGGGLRNTYGKLYGLRDQQAATSSLSTKANWVGADFRSIFYVPEKTKPVPTVYPTAKSGLGIMTSIVSAHVPVSTDASGNQLAFSGSYNFGAFVTGLRDVNISYASEVRRDQLTVGKFTMPFGLLTDEHRTLIRVQTRTGYNDFQTGVMWSKDSLNKKVHIDLGLTNGLQNGPAEAEGQFSNGMTWGSFFNARHLIGSWPMFIGLSGYYSERNLGFGDPWSASVYQAYSFDRATNYLFKGALLLEYSVAKYWNDTSINPELSRQTSSTMLNSGLLQNSTSNSAMAQVIWDLSTTWSLLYKYENLLLDRHFSGDTFERHGVGFRHDLMNNLILSGRFEFSSAGSATVSEYEMGAQNAYYVVLHAWL